MPLLLVNTTFDYKLYYALVRNNLYEIERIQYTFLQPIRCVTASFASSKYFVFVSTITERKIIPRE